MRPSKICCYFQRVMVGQCLPVWLLLICSCVQAELTANLQLISNHYERSGCPHDPYTPLLEIEEWEYLVRPKEKFTPDIGNHVIRNDLNHGHDEFLAMKVLTLRDGSQRLLATGYGVNVVSRAEPDTPGSGEDFLLTRFYPFGFPDPAFGSEGRVVMDFFRNNDRVWDILPLNDGSGRFLVAGSAYNAARTGEESTGKDMVIMRFFEDGEVDTGFGAAGRVIRDFRQGDDEVHALALIEHNNNPMILAVGYGTHVLSENSDQDAVLMGLTLAGEPAPGCSDNGVQAWDNTGRDDGFRTVTVIPLSESNRRIIAGGYTTGSNTAGGNYLREFLLAGFSPGCELESGFGDNGIVHWGLNDFDSVWAVRATAHDNTAQVLVAGITRWRTQYPDSWLVLYRYQPDGTLDSSFGSEGRAEAVVRYPEDTPVTLEVIHDDHSEPNIMVGKFAIMDCQKDRDLNALLSYHLNGTRSEYGMDFSQFGEGEAAVRAIVNITGSDGRRQLVVAGYGFGATSVGCGCSTQRDTVLAGFLATGKPDNCFSTDEQYLRARPECASLVPEVFPTKKPTDTPNTPTATNTTPDTGTRECPSAADTNQVAVLSAVMSLSLVGNVALGITTGLLGFYVLSKHRKANP